MNTLPSTFISSDQGTLTPDLSMQLPTSHFHLHFSQTYPNLSHYLHTTPPLDQISLRGQSQWPSQKSTILLPHSPLSLQIHNPVSIHWPVYIQSENYKIAQLESESEEKLTTILLYLRTDHLLVSCCPFLTYSFFNSHAYQAILLDV